MPQVRSEDHWAIEQNLLGLSLPNLVMVPVLVRVARIPLEPLKTSEEFVEHAHEKMYMTILYNCQGWEW